MGDFKRGGFGGGNRGGDRGGFQKKSFGGNRGGGFGGGNRGGDRGPVSMHKAVCDECTKSCEVPFRPSNDKPIYCNDCFGGKRESGDRAPRKEFGNRDARPSFGDRAPRPEFTKTPSSAPTNDNTAKQLSEINAKLDRLASAIEKLTTPKAEASFVKVAPVVAAPKVEAKKVEAKKEVKKAVKAPAAKAVKTPAKKPTAPAKKVVAKKKK
jgi:CxxC-x17-CxxC domain-containing protein